jgi:hypothetical protein
MRTLSRDGLIGLLNGHGTPCLSLFQPTHRHHPGNQQDPIRFRNLTKTLEDSLRRKFAARDVQAWLEPFRDLAADEHFWQHTLDGLAVLATPASFEVYSLQRAVPELAVVADSFHTKPLLRIVQSADRYQILGLARNEVTMFEGNRDAVDPIPLGEGVPRTLADALGDELTEPHMTVASYGTGVRGPAMHHGQGSRKDELQVDDERFFRVVDRAVAQRHSRPSGLPLILAALPEHQGLFRPLSHNPALLADGIDTHPSALSAEALRERAWGVVEPQYVARLARLVAEFHEARAKDRGADELAAIARAAVEARVGTLLVDAGRQAAGRIDRATGDIERVDLSEPDADDLIDDLGELVLEQKGDVVVVPSDRMPTASGAAAIFRY